MQGHQPPDQAAQSHIQPGLECLQGWGIYNLLGQLSWFCNFAIGIPHHNIMDKREELRIPEDLTVGEGRHITEDTSSGCARFFFTFACCRERSECAFRAGRLHQVRLSVSETLSLSLSLPLYRSFALSLPHSIWFIILTPN